MGNVWCIRSAVSSSFVQEPEKELTLTDTSQLPVAVIGAGPVGLAAAAHLAARNIPPLIFESGERVGSALLDWGHITLFTPWRWIVDSTARQLLEADGWQSPDEERFPTAREVVELYLEPLAKLPAIASGLRLGSRATDVARVGIDKLKDGRREQQPFEVHVEGDRGAQRIWVRAVIDASGTWWSPNPIGANGLPAVGEKELAAHIAYAIPDVLGELRRRYAGQRVAVIGSGHSAQNVVRDLDTLASDAPETAVTWLVRRPETGQMFGGGSNDQLPARARLGSRARALVDAGEVRLEAGFRIAELAREDDGIVIVSEDGRRAGPFDQLVAATGFRPDLAMLRETRLDIDPIVETTPALAPLVDPNVHSCASVPPHGFSQLSHSEPDLYIVGAKSYGRAPTFLLPTGYEQVRSVAAALDGDFEAARTLMFDLPETGVCVTDPGANAGAGAACCGIGAPIDTVEPLPMSEPEPSAAGGCCSPTEPAPAATNTTPHGCCGSPAADPDPVGAAASGGCCG